MLFYKEEYKSYYVMMSAFKIFYDASGLKANTKKSEIFIGGMKEREKARIGLWSGNYL